MVVVSCRIGRMIMIYIQQHPLVMNHFQSRAVDILRSGKDNK